VVISHNFPLEIPHSQGILACIIKSWFNREHTFPVSYIDGIDAAIASARSELEDGGKYNALTHVHILFKAAFIRPVPPLVAGGTG
jgi:hypothetical protein